MFIFKLLGYWTNHSGFEKYFQKKVEIFYNFDGNDYSDNNTTNTTSTDATINTTTTRNNNRKSKYDNSKTEIEKDFKQI